MTFSQRQEYAELQIKVIKPEVRSCTNLFIQVQAGIRANSYDEHIHSGSVFMNACNPNEWSAEEENWILNSPSFHDLE